MRVNLKFDLLPRAPHSAQSAPTGTSVCITTSHLCYLKHHPPLPHGYFPYPHSLNQVGTLSTTPVLVVVTSPTVVTDERVVENGHGR